MIHISIVTAGHAAHGPAREHGLERVSAEGPRHQQTNDKLQLQTANNNDILTIIRHE